MTTQNHEDRDLTYRTITGGRIPLSNLSDAERGFLTLVARKYNARQDWTRFAAWWNAQFNAAGLDTSSVIYRICQDLESRLGINQGKVAPPDYRDFLGELIDSQFGSRQGFCQAAGVDPGQLSRVLANRGDLSLKVLQKVLDVLHAQLVIQTEEESRTQTSVERAAEVIADALAVQSQPALIPVEAASNDPEQPLSRKALKQLIEEQVHPLREQVKRLQRELQAVGVGSK